MIAKCKAVSHTRTVLEYAMRADKMERIIAGNYLLGRTPSEIFSEFELVNSHNSRCKNKCLRFEIGIAPQDQTRLNPEDINKITATFADKMGLLDNYQWIAVTHKDTDHLHIHLIANRIGLDGTVYDTTFVGNRSAKAAEEISREMGLTIAKEVKAQREYVSRGMKEHAARAQEECAAYFGRERLAAWGLDQDRLTVRAELQKLAYESLRDSQTPKDFLNDLRRKKVRVVPMKNKQGRVYGLRFVYKGEEFKASEIGREFGLNSLYNHYGIRRSTQKGNTFVPEYAKSAAGQWRQAVTTGLNGIAASANIQPLQTVQYKAVAKATTNTSSPSTPLQTVAKVAGVVIGSVAEATGTVVRSTVEATGKIVGTAASIAADILASGNSSDVDILAPSDQPNTLDAATASEIQQRKLKKKGRKM